MGAAIPGAQAGHEGGGLPVAVGDPGPQALTLWGTTAQPSHVGGRPGLVDEDEPGGIEVELALEPGFPSRQDVGAILLGCVGGLFLNVRPARSRKVQIVPVDASTSASTRSRESLDHERRLAAMALDVRQAQDTIVRLC